MVIVQVKSIVSWPVTVRQFLDHSLLSSSVILIFITSIGLDSLFRHQHGFCSYPELGTTHFKSRHLFLSKEHKASEQTCRIPEILLSLLVYVTFCQHFFNILDHYYTKCFNKCIRQSKSILA